MTVLIARIEGYAARFNAPDLNGDVMLPGAFRRRRPAADIRLLYQHAADQPIGRWISFAEDAAGLWAVGELLLSSPRARETHALLAGRAIDGLSIGFRTVKATREKGRRLIAEADLWEVSVVTFPMAEGARVRAVGPPEPEAPASADALFAGALRRAADLLSV